MEENVKVIFLNRHIESFKDIMKLFDEARYDVKYKLMNVKDYRFPRDREY